MDLPVGYFKFHKNAFINYQLNRWHSLGYARKQDIEETGSKINSFEDYVREFTKAGEKALAENRLKNAATYFRAAEFLIVPGSKNKLSTYDRFIELFDRAFADEDFERIKVPYQNSFLSALKLPAQGEKRGIILACGGFDSFIEEFYCIWRFFADNGYDVIAFEGPGQGGTLRKHQLTFDHDWEKPVTAILDHFSLQNVTLLGVSMGGYWVIRAAAFEKRIKKVIAMGPVYDWMEMTNSFNKKLVDKMLGWRGIMNFFIRMKMRVGTLRHTINQALFISGGQEPVDAVKWMLGMNKNHIHSEKVTQDVLLLTGENDAFQPPVLLQKQKEALINAKTITTKVFLKSEHADQHCQIGNIGLALETILKWLEEKK